MSCPVFITMFVFPSQPHWYLSEGRNCWSLSHVSSMELWVKLNGIWLLTRNSSRPNFKVGQFSSVQFSRSVVSNSLRPHGLQHTRPPCPSPTPKAYSNSCPLSRWCLPTISSSVVPFSSRLQSFPASGSFPMSQFFTSGGQSIGVSTSASVLPMNIQDWFPLGLTGLISLLSKGLRGVFFKVQRHQFFGAQPFLLFSSHFHTWLQKKL